jgi:hypothetical protein
VATAINRVLGKKLCARSQFLQAAKSQAPQHQPKLAKKQQSQIEEGRKICRAMNMPSKLKIGSMASSNYGKEEVAAQQTTNVLVQ